MIDREGYHFSRPRFSFLFEMDANPIVASARATFAGRIDTWVWKLGSGWPDHEMAPAAAFLLFTLWLVVLAAALAWLRRVARPELE